MACCILAAFLLAQLSLMMRRWGQFVGVVALDKGQTTTTLPMKIRALLARPLVRLLLLLTLIIEGTAFTTWVVVDHGAHIAHLSRQLLTTARAAEVIFVTVCTADGRDKQVPVRLN